MFMKKYCVPISVTILYVPSMDATDDWLDGTDERHTKTPESVFTSGVMSAPLPCAWWRNNHEAAFTKHLGFFLPLRREEECARKLTTSS